jgi:hypothetical protein
MGHRKTRRRLGVIWAAGLLALTLPLTARGADKSKSTALPSLEQVAKAVVGTFDALSDHEPGDIITQTEATKALAAVQKLGWAVPDGKALLKRVPAEGEFLVEVLRTDGGRRFMRQISGYPMGYDRLDRLSLMPHGKKTVRALVRGPDGYKMIEYMTTHPGGKGLGRQLSRGKRGAGFNDPTGRIYTAEDLLDEVRQLYEEAKKARQTPARKLSTR